MDKKKTMVQLGKTVFIGKSGEKYIFDTYDLSSSWDSVAAIYVVTRMEGGTNHVVYIGQTNNLELEFGNHPRQSCFKQNKANCLCLKIEMNPQNRRSVETDLLREYFTKCNY
jgi:hypothetical protein